MTAPLDEKGLLPCPFCNDPMKVVHGTLSHVDQGDCPIGAYAWGGENAIAAWNRRAYLSAVALPDELGVAAWFVTATFNSGTSITDWCCYVEDAQSAERRYNSNPDVASVTTVRLCSADQAHSTIAALRAAIATPEAVHANMLRGSIPKLSIRQALHLHGAGALEKWDRAEAAEAEVTRLTEEKEALRFAHKSMADFVRPRIPEGQNIEQAESFLAWIGMIVRLEERGDKAMARIKALEEALRPFAEAAGYYAPEDYADEQFVVNVSTVTRTGEEVEAVLRRGDYRRARAALNSREKAE